MNGKFSKLLIKIFKYAENNYLTMKELTFYVTKAEEINKKYSGKHIAIVGNKVVAFGDSAIEVLKKARKKHPQSKPVLTYVPEKDTLVLILNA